MQEVAAKETKLSKLTLFFKYTITIKMIYNCTYKLAMSYFILKEMS